MTGARGPRSWLKGQAVSGRAEVQPKGCRKAWEHSPYGTIIRRGSSDPAACGVAVRVLLDESPELSALWWPDRYVARGGPRQAFGALRDRPVLHPFLLKQVRTPPRQASLLSSASALRAD